MSSGQSGVAHTGAAHLVERLLADHRRIEQCASELLDDCARGDCVVALLGLAELHLEMERHDGVEENALFPLLGRKLPDLEERLALVRRQHRAAERRRAELERTLLDGDAAGAAQGADELYALLVGNHTTEELVVYAALDELVAHLDDGEESACRR